MALQTRCCDCYLPFRFPLHSLLLHPTGGTGTKVSTHILYIFDWTGLGRRALCNQPTIHRSYHILLKSPNTLLSTTFQSSIKPIVPTPLPTLIRHPNLPAKPSRPFSKAPISHYILVMQPYLPGALAPSFTQANLKPLTGTTYSSLLRGCHIGHGFIGPAPSMERCRAGPVGFLVCSAGLCIYSTIIPWRGGVMASKRWRWK